MADSEADSAVVPGAADSVVDTAAGTDEGISLSRQPFFVLLPSKFAQHAQISCGFSKAVSLI